MQHNASGSAQFVAVS